MKSAILEILLSGNDCPTCNSCLDIVHRDLKLENILLSHPVGNELFNIKVMDQLYLIILCRDKP